jgi:hypothetical protein
MADTLSHLFLALTILLSQDQGITVLVLDVNVIHLVASTRLLVILIAVHGISML